MLLQDADQVIAAMPSSTDGYYHRGFALYHLQQYAGEGFADRLAIVLAMCFTLRYAVMLFALTSRVYCRRSTCIPGGAALEPA